MKHERSPVATTERAAYRVAEVAKMLGVSRSTAFRAVERGELRAVRLGGCVLVPADEVRRVLSRGVNTEGAAR